MNTIVEQKEVKDELNRQVEGLIDVCKYLSDKSEIEKSVVNFIPWDPHVVFETKRRIIGNSDFKYKDMSENKKDNYYYKEGLRGFKGY